MKNSLILLFLLYSVLANAQTDRFFKLYDYNKEGNYFQGNVEFNKKIYSSGVSFGANRKAFIQCTSKNGEIIWQRALLMDSSNSSFSSFTRVLITKNKTLLLSGTVGYRDTSKALEMRAQPSLLELDTNGNILNEWVNFEYYDTLNFGQRVYQELNGNMILGCVSYSEDQRESNPSLIILDSLGNEVIRKDYAIFPNKKKVGLNDFIPLKDKGYLMLGYQKAVTSSNYNGMLIRVDSNLNVVWKGEYGTSGYEEITAGIQLKDEHILVCGLKDNPNGSANHRDAWLMKININNGTIVREKAFSFKIYNSFRGLTENPDGSIVLAGGVDSLDSLSSNAHIVKLTPQWEVIWSQNYGMPHVPGRTGSPENVFGFSPTTDDGFILVGFSHDKSLEQSTQDAMLLKVDSNGCLAEGCTYTGIAEEELKMQNIVLYPNPASEYLNVKIPTEENNCVYEILNTLGEIQKRGNITVEELHIQDLSKGLYVLRLYTSKGVIYLKFLKQ